MGGRARFIFSTKPRCGSPISSARAGSTGSSRSAPPTRTTCGRSKQMPMCEAGRYHVAPWQHVFLVDRDAETALPTEGQVEGRVAIFDFLVEGRWGATLTTDEVTMDHGTCGCGRPGPTILDTISRYT